MDVPIKVIFHLVFAIPRGWLDPPMFPGFAHLPASQGSAHHTRGGQEGGKGTAESQELQKDRVQRGLADVEAWFQGFLVHG